MLYIKRLLLFSLLLAPKYMFSQQVGQVSCNDERNPSCLDDPQPRFSWMITQGRRGEKQTAYQVLVASSRAKLDRGTGDVWNSGKVWSSQSNYMLYGGKPLVSRQTYCWKIRIWNAAGIVSAWSEPGYWTMGLLQASDWKGQWITASKWFTAPAYRPKGLELSASGGWADIDLGAVLPVDTIRLVPYERERFPARFVIMGSGEFNFLHTTILADQRSTDYSFNGSALPVFAVSHVRCRYIRLQILPNQEKKQTIVRQLEVISGGVNVAMRRFTREYGTAWDHGHAPFLVDGMPSQYEGDTCPVDACSSTAAPAFRKTVTVSKTIRQATLYAAALGMMDITINGLKAGREVLTPPFTDYYKRIMYDSYDITSLLKQGDNTIGVVLGNGFFSTPSLGFGQRHNGNGPPGFMLQADIEYTDGSRRLIATDTSWKWARSEIVFNDVWQGYTEDRRLLKAGWDNPSYNDSNWLPAGTLQPPGGRLVARTGPLVRINNVIKPVRVAGNHAYFETASVGWPLLKVNGRAGQQIVITGSGPGYSMAKLTYILVADGPATLSPRFILQPGPTDLQVEGLRDSLSANDIAIQYVAADLDNRSAFTCSNPWLNHLYEVTLRTHRNYISDIPADPNREKQGWTQDVQNMFYTASCFSDTRSLYRRWWMDMADNQDEQGYTGSVVPMTHRQVYDWNSPWWSGMIVFLPWQYYQFYGDRSLLEKGYSSMCSYVNFLNRMANAGEGRNWNDYPYFTQHLDSAAAREGMIIWNGAGDWNNPFTRNQHAVPTPVTTMTAWYYYAVILGKTARLLGKESDALLYDKMAAKIKARFNSRYFNAYTGLYGDSANNETAQVLPLAVGIVREGKEALVYKRLEEAIHLRGDHIGTGFTATDFLLQLLAKKHASALANKMINQQDYPGWNTLVKAGVLQEDWGGGGAQMPSCGGAVGGWLFQSVLGIQPDTAHPGFREFILAPQPDPATNLTAAKGFFESGYGKIAIDWKCEAGKFRADIEVPANTRARLYLPANNLSSVRESGKPVKNNPAVGPVGKDIREAIYTIGPGSYHFESAYSLKNFPVPTQPLTPAGTSPVKVKASFYTVVSTR